MLTEVFSDRLTSNQVAEALGLKPQTLDKWRCTGRYELPFYKIGRRVFYRRGDVEVFLESCRRAHT
jgi:predicted site-specific integrase-resolvase